FEMQGSYLRHIPSHHLLNFDIWGNARVHARCDCAMLDVSREQSEEMKAAISAWKVVYWEPHLARIEAERRAAKINREFASHFRPSRWQRILSYFRGQSAEVTTLVPDDGSELIAESRGTAEQRAATARARVLVGD